MPTVEVFVNGRRHEVQCGEGEEGRVKRLAGYVDRKINELGRGQNQPGDTRLLLLASLMVADELSDISEELARVRGLLEERTSMSEQAAAAAVEEVARHLDAIAAHLEHA